MGPIDITLSSSHLTDAYLIPGPYLNAANFLLRRYFIMVQVEKMKRPPVKLNEEPQ